MSSKELHALTPRQLHAWKPPYQQWIISHGLLVAEGTLMIYGDEQTFKSMLAQDMMVKIGTGQRWLGFETIKSPVLYYQTELPQAMMKVRMDQYMEGHNLSWESDLTDQCYICSSRYVRIDKGYGANMFERLLDRIQPKVVIIDPMIFSFAANLCDPHDVGESLNRLDMWKEERKLCIIMIHHSNQAEYHQGEKFHHGTASAFGVSTIPDWFDTMIHVDKVQDDPDTNLVDLKLTFEKHRHSHTVINPVDMVLDRETLRAEMKGVM